MDIKLKPFDFTQAATRAGMPQVAQRVRDSARAAGLSESSTSATSATPTASFSHVLNQALRTVSDAQQVAGQLQRDVASDAPGASIERTMVAMQKSQVSFQAALQVRNRLVQAYSDVMNMQV